MSKVEKFLNKMFPTQNDESTGLPLNVKVNDQLLSMLSQYDRNTLYRNIKYSLTKQMHLPEEMAETMAQGYVKQKWEEIKKML
jgi:hypothetical protein